MQVKEQRQIKHSVDHLGCYVIENYNQAKPFSNFFPGIAGLFGVPMWLFYVNRGQCVTSFGIEAKDKAIMEFQPANKAYRYTSQSGFRTFIKVKTATGVKYWEPFQDNLPGTDYNKSTNMCMRVHDLTLVEVNEDLGLQVDVTYFTLPEESYPALIRKVKVINLTDEEKEIEIIDGLPVINPYGLSDWLSKNMARTVEAWVKVRNLETNAPFFQLNVEVADTPEVKYITEGHFYFAFEEGQKKLLPAIVEASTVFGQSVDFSGPTEFLSDDFALPKVQQTSNRMPSSMTHAKMTLSSQGDNKTIVSSFGYAHDQERLKKIVKQITEKNFIKEKEQRNQDLIEEIRNYAMTNSSSAEFNLYSGHTFLDNILRGGVPVSLKTDDGNIAFNVYSRKHGDLERDYNYFVVSPTYYSQGNGNFRDVNQNRRNDAWFNKDVKDSHIIGFMNLTQADGYNPLVVKGTAFRVKEDANLNQVRSSLESQSDMSLLEGFFKKPFQPGELLNFIEKENIGLKVSIPEFTGNVLEVSQKSEQADHGEGFWSDHWTYNLDLIESYLAVYPEKLKQLLVEKKIFQFFFNNHYVLPRDERYILTDKGVRQYESVKEDSTIDADSKGWRLRVNHGNGEIYQSTLLCKLLCVIANKAATLDPSGIGIEMEADKPNWYDALNGLPGLLGSAISESFELKRYAQFVLNSVEQLGYEDEDEILVFTELYSFLKGLNDVLNSEEDALSYWNKSNDVKEIYRLSIRNGIKGSEEGIRVFRVKNMMTRIIDRIDRAKRNATNDKGFLPTYFFHEVTDYTVLKEGAKGEDTYVEPKKFKRHDLPLYLEGYVHAMRFKPGQDEARALYQNVRSSGLYDRKLKMYKVNDNLTSQSEEIGRCRVFPSGWLENESVWLHMEYKYLLETLRNGLYEEFFEDVKNAMIPFLDGEVYGRSTLENSSFIVSSAHEDENLHGQGFVARLSGSTAEFLHMWLMMNVGENPFSVDENGDLRLTFTPGLAEWLFTTEPSTVNFWDRESKNWIQIDCPENTYAFNFLGSTVVVYHNPSRKNLFADGVVQKIVLTCRDKSETQEFTQGYLSGQMAKDVRDSKVQRIDVFFE